MPTAHEIHDAVARHAERQMRKWATGLEVLSRVEHEHALEQLPEQVQPYIALSRETGAGGEEIGRIVADRLAFDLLDRELLHYLAESHNLPDAVCEFVDETTRNWVFELFGRWMGPRVVTQTEYVTRLGQVLLLAARHKSAVIIGRGAQFYLPKERGLRVWIIAPLGQRIEAIMRQRNLDRAAAAEYVERTDRERADFVQRYFHHDPEDAHLYDLVVNRDGLSAEDAAELIVRRFECGPWRRSSRPR